MAYQWLDDVELIKDKKMISNRDFLILAVLIYAIIILSFVTISSVFMENDWAGYDMKRFYAMADVIVSGATPYLDYEDPKPPLIFFTLALPVIIGQRYLGGLLLVGLCNLISAALIMKMGWKLYGRFPGFIAGFLFSANVAWAQGYFIITEPFALTLMLLSIYVMLFTDIGSKHMISGILAGIAIGFKQYAILILPLAIYVIYKRMDMKKLPEFLTGLIAPLAIIFAAILFIYGAEALSASLYWSFGIAGTYAISDSMGNVSAYRPSDPIMIAANIIMSVSLFTSLFIMALSSYFIDRPVRYYENFFIISALVFSSTILIRQYLHYWILALPFIVILCARLFRSKNL
jgi:hypothetical protein